MIICVGVAFGCCLCCKYISCFLRRWHECYTLWLSTPGNFSLWSLCLRIERGDGISGGFGMVVFNNAEVCEFT